MDNPLAERLKCSQARAMPWQGNESELRLAITQKNLVAFYRQEQTWIFSCRNQPDFHHFSGNCRGSTESSSRRIRNTLILGLVHNLFCLGAPPRGLCAEPLAR